jgi:hypothetical protein
VRFFQQEKPRVQPGTIFIRRRYKIETRHRVVFSFWKKSQMVRRGFGLTVPETFS